MRLAASRYVHGNGAPRGGTLIKGKVLVVEDDPTTTAFLGDALAQQGYEVVVTCGGRRCRSHPLCGPM